MREGDFLTEASSKCDIEVESPLAGAGEMMALLKMLTVQTRGPVWT